MLCVFRVINFYLVHDNDYSSKTHRGSAFSGVGFFSGEFAAAIDTEKLVGIGQGMGLSHPA
jgi:hypothetical protein